MAPRARGRPRGALEEEIIACLAAAGRPLSPADVRAELGDRLAYTTVMTTLARLHGKGALTRQEAGRGYVYALQDGPDQAHASMTARRMLRLLESGRDRESVLARFVADLDEDDERMLAELLAGSGSVDPQIELGTEPRSQSGADARSEPGTEPHSELGTGGRTDPSGVPGTEPSEREPGRRRGRGGGRS